MSRPVALLLFALCGCSTQTYRSDLPSEVVAPCIARGWKTSGASGFTVPISTTKTDTGYLVQFITFTPWPSSPLLVPVSPVWAKVTDAAPGSTTEYHREMQFTHARIDAAVTACQSGTPP